MQKDVNVNKNEKLANVHSALIHCRRVIVIYQLDSRYLNRTNFNIELKADRRSKTRYFDTNLGYNSKKPTFMVNKVASNYRSVLESSKSDDLAINLKDPGLRSAALL